MNLKIYHLIFTRLSYLVIADYSWSATNEGDYISTGCESSLDDIATFCDDSDDECWCDNINALGSMVYCGYEHTVNSSSSRRHFKDWYLDECGNLTGTQLDEVYENVTKYIVADPFTSVPDYNSSAIIDYPVGYNQTTYEETYNAEKSGDEVENHSVYFGAGLIAYWAGIILIGAVLRLLRITGLNRHFPNLFLSRLIRAKFTLPALTKKKHASNWLWGAIPTRIESLIIFIWFALCVIFCATRIHNLKGNVYFITTHRELATYVGNRAGILVCYMMILTFMFGGRNNFFIWLTGWKFSTFVTYHKWIARTTVLMLFVHAVSYLFKISNNGSYPYYMQDNFYRWGCVAAVCGGTMFLQGMAFLRRNWYEMFLYFHIVLAVFFLIGAWRHVDELGFQNFAYATCAMWCFDRFIRLVRIWILFGGYKKSKVKAVADETLELIVPYNKTTFRVNPGSFAFVYFGTWKCFWQSHPFTMIPYPEEGYVKICVKVKKGCTSSLYKEVMNCPEKEKDIYLSLEGPYGSYHNLTSYDHVLLYSGGNGVPGPFAYARELCVNTNFKGFVKFYWVIRHWHSLDWFYDELKSLEQYSDKIQIVICLSRYKDFQFGEHDALYSDSDIKENNVKVKETKISDSDSAQEEKIMPLQDQELLAKIESKLPHVEFREGRPDIEQIVVADLNEATVGRTCVMSCAHSNMCDDIRYVVSREILKKNNPIDFIEELQGW
ncbi:ferric reductase family protein SCDLUD_000075 [Saccharomycodes ludwigii]|uniref:ferric reductase family protein n=1 Tax=Saccharomycodes ludwigii TaxID=36035 RepID=UPI001E899646|nr:hypothetical protein SCDLUD_000075 [Saccharomycodes ludwigii]KAH3902498.1 hypothetical protein SCDLUD_000075 [Saccharomycodes ludwigii]